MRILNAQPIIPQEIEDLLKYVGASRMSFDIKIWREALLMAETMQDRSSLYTLYQDIADDDQVTSSVSQRKNGVILADFGLFKQNGDIDEEATEKFKKLWFLKFLNSVLDAVYYGFSLVSLTDYEPVPFVNLVPELEAIRIDPFGGNFEENLIFYNQTDYAYSLVESFISRRSLGLFNKVAPYYIWKKAFGSWAELGGRFGMPFRIIRTDLQDKARVQNAKRMMQNMIGAGWAILSEADDYSEIQRSSVNASSNLYERLIIACDKAIAKIIVGQTSTTDEQAWSGTSQVHKNILDSYIAIDKVFVSAVINDNLLPRLAYFGEIPNGLTFKFLTTDNMPLREKAEIVDILSRNYNVPVEFVKNWLKIEVEEKVPLGAPVQEATNFVELVNFDKIKPIGFDEKVLKGGVIKLIAETKDGKVIYGYRFPQDWDEKRIEGWLKQRGIKK